MLSGDGNPEFHLTRSFLIGGTEVLIRVQSRSFATLVASLLEGAAQLARLGKERAG
jgi:hypothetical protein